MVYFSKLKLYGFKSFVDKAEIEIGEGLNGIVGPNGCGKSNLVEALRWVMGEKSAKNMRGGGMEDVIFAGTSKRPARNMAEATIIIDNSDGTAPAPFNTATEIEINRRIEKDKGSQYRVNGKAVRARDVNLLFADTMTGANSPALVSQGRITEIIVAKPQDRRRILEESAGISGLHTRRHEAELRLRAAEQNLTRLDDSLNDVRARLANLKRQSRQAERYKELSASIRRLDMALIWSQWRDARNKIKSGRTEFAAENNIVQKVLEETKNITRTIEKLEKDLPIRRTENMEARAILQNFRVSLERLEQDIQNKTQGLRDAENAKAQLDQDLEFTQEQMNQNIQNIQNLEKDITAAKSNGETLPDRISELTETCAITKTRLDELTTHKQDLETQIAIATKSRTQNENRRDEYQLRLNNLQDSKNALDDKIMSLTKEKASLENDPILKTDIIKIENILEDLQNTISQKAKILETQTEKQDILREQERDLASNIRGIESEVNALSDLIARAETQSDLSAEDALLNHLSVKSGYEKAVSVALGHWASQAGLDGKASTYWAENGVKTQTPKGFEPLSGMLDAPQSLNALLSAIGVCEMLPDTLPALQSGQMIISVDGGLMRWDGLIAKASASSATDTTSLILEQKNRIQTLSTDLETQTSELETITKGLKTAAKKIECTQDELQSLRYNYQTEQNGLTQTRHAQDRLKDRLSSFDSTLNGHNDQLENIITDLTQVQAQYDEISVILSNDNAEANKAITTQIENINTQITSISEHYDEQQSALAQLRFEQSASEQSIRTFTQNINRLKEEKETLSKRLDDISARLDQSVLKITDYKATQDSESEDSVREGLLNKIFDQENIVSKNSEQLEAMENDYRIQQTSLREAESNAASAREKRAVIQTNVANAEDQLKRIENIIEEKFETNPQSLEEETLSLFGETLPPLNDLQNERETTLRQRDNIGPVNLRAAIESQETEEHLAEMESESADLTKAIEQLRGGIAKLNREARERLAIAFKRVDGHFQKLFSDLFQGGKAYLEMIESEDPLESGLEIYAQPPGKSLQKLSLLSGGEQTLTATALIFAMFLTNPSPICVLDEIDAPLDDANVDRVCSLMEQIARDTDTRFIVITHHRMTMARMDRLYGVTMSERGVSQLVSVDIAMQEELVLNNQESA